MHRRARRRPAGQQAATRAGNVLTGLRHRLPAALAAVLGLALQGCAVSPERQAPLPASLASQAHIPGIPRARQWGDEPPAELATVPMIPDEALRERYGGVMERSHQYLALSGGGGNGAFGAGLLAGWTEHGSRPEFEIVTGISTGALTAPFAFLGPAYDARLREIYTAFSTDDLVELRNPVEILFGDAAASTLRLRGLIARYVNDEVLAAIAAEGRKGRSLLIGTTNLDAGRPVIWDLTRIAASGSPRARELIHDVLLASASIPGAFPPVIIEVEAEGRRYDEMHVDGGVTSQLFLFPRGTDWNAMMARLRVRGSPDLYLIRNSKLSPRWQTVPTRVGPVVARSLSTLIRTQGIGDLAQIYITANDHGMDYHLAYIPGSFTAEPTETFDPEYMAALFELGYRQARQGYPWTTVADR
jgi:hypothetical protein